MSYLDAYHVTIGLRVIFFVQVFKWNRVSKMEEWTNIDLGVDHVLKFNTMWLKIKATIGGETIFVTIIEIIQEFVIYLLKYKNELHE